MKKFEYKTIKINTKKSFWNSDFDLEGIDRTLNELGSQGWELVSVEDIEQAGSSWYFHYTFKREI